MEHGKIILAEDNAGLSDTLTHFIQSASSHNVVATPRNLRNTLVAIQAVADGTLEADAIILDGNLGPGSVDCEDARTVVAAIKEAGLSLHIIGFSSESFTANGIDATVDLTKNSTSRLIPTLDEL